MRVTRSKRWVARHKDRFQGVSETEADPPGAPIGPPPTTRACGPVAFDCPRTRTPQSLDSCVRCPYFVDFRPVPQRRLVILTCQCSDSDPILRSSDRRRSWPTVDADTPLREARRLALMHEAPLVLVKHEDEALGVVYRDQLEASDETVAGRVHEYPWSLSTRATLGDAVEALRISGAPALLVLAPDGELVGVVSPAYLEHLGVPAPMLGR